MTTKIGKWKYSIFYLITEPPLTLPRVSVLLTYCTIEQFELNYLTAENTTSVHQEVKERDTRLKNKMKNYSNSKNKAKSSDIKEGDVVLVRQPKSNKLCTKYNPATFQVRRRQGNRITAVKNGKYITRNVSFFKKLFGAKHDESSHLWDQIDEDDYLSDLDLGDMVGQNDPARDPVRYPVRRRQRVQRFGNNIYD